MNSNERQSRKPLEDTMSALNLKRAHAQIGTVGLTGRALALDAHAQWVQIPRVSDGSVASLREFPTTEPDLFQKR